jgi:hypothetical protein
MKSLLTFFLTLIVSLAFQPAFSKPVTKTAATVVASRFMARWGNPGDLKSGVKPNLICKEYGKLMNSTGTLSESPAFYVFNTDNSGFIIVSGEDRVPAVLAYSDKGNVDFDNIPYNFESFLKGYENEINFAIKNNLAPSPGVKEEWTKYLNDDRELKSSAVMAVVEPLTTTQWGYGKPFNDLCPADNKASIKNGRHCPAGCTAIAMAQVMKYWDQVQLRKYWTQATRWYDFLKGYGSNSYEHNIYGTLSANFGATNYKWDIMPDVLDTTSEVARKNAVATLMYHCGISVDMEYGPSSSGSYFRADPIGLPGKNCVETAFPKYFGYKNSIKAVVKSYSDSIWKEMIKKEVIAKRPVIYAGEDKDQGYIGHAFVIDGLDNSDRFHVNWGLYGVYNGYFLVNLLGFDIYNFTSNACILIGIEPEQIVKSENIALSEPIRIWPNPASARLHVDLNGTMEDCKEIDILNSLGMNILNVPYTGTQLQIPLDRMTSGVYFIRFNNRENYITRKFVVEK